MPPAEAATSQRQLPPAGAAHQQGQGQQQGQQLPQEEHQRTQVRQQNESQQVQGQQHRTRPTQGQLVELVIASWEQRWQAAAATAGPRGSTAVPAATASNTAPGIRTGQASSGASTRGSSTAERPPYALIDVGLNFVDPSYDKDRPQVLARAARVGVAAVIVTGTCLRTSAAAARLADSSCGAHSGTGSAGDGTARLAPPLPAAAVAALDAPASNPQSQPSNAQPLSPSSSPALYFTAGVHPHNAKGCGPATLPALRQLAAHPRCVAIGECGLDFNRNFSLPEVQVGAGGWGGRGCGVGSGGKGERKGRWPCLPPHALLAAGGAGGCRRVRVAGVGWCACGREGSGTWGA